MTSLGLNFGGFYGSMYEFHIDGQIESVWCDHEDYDHDEIYGNVNFKATYHEMARMVVQGFNQATNLNLQFDKLFSPKFYNFENDKIMLLPINNEDMETLDRNINKIINENNLYDDVVKMISNYTLSRPGYYAFFTADNIPTANLTEIKLEVLYNHFESEIEDYVTGNTGLIFFNDDVPYA